MRVGGGVDDAEVVAQPFDARAGREHHRLDPPGLVTGALPRHDRERARRRRGGRSRGAGHPRTGRASPLSRRWPSPARAACSPGRRATPAGRRRCRRSPDHRAVPPPRPPLPTSPRWRAGRSWGCAARRACVSSQSVPSPASSPVMPALVASVTCSAPPESVHATQVSTVPKHRSRVRSGSAMSRSMDRPWSPIRWAPPGCPGPAAPGTCRRCGGPASRCPAPRALRCGRSHTIGRAPVGWRSPPPPPGRFRTSVAPATSSTAVPWRRRRTRRTRARATTAAPRHGGRGRWSRPRRPRRPARSRCPTSTTRMRTHGQRTSPNGRGKAELARVEDPPGVQAVLQPTEHVEDRRRGRRP